MIDASSIQAYGQWVLLKVIPPPTMSKGGLYLPAGNLEERLGHQTGFVMSFGVGRQTKKGDCIPIGVKRGDKVVFRGYLKGANRPGGQLDKEHCLIHMDDIVGTVED
jgi:co-chaperonin GroES (HSP10)